MGLHVRWRVAVAAAAAVLLAGCAAAPEIPYDRGTAGEIHSIGILTPSFPEKPTVFLASTPGQSFGLVGLIIDTSLQTSRESHFTTLLQERSFSEQDCFVASLTAGLQAQGYTVAVVPFKRETRQEFAVKYPTGPAPDVDAYLDLVATTYGYMATGIGADTPYRPWLEVRARLVNARDGSVLMQDIVVYNPLNGRDHVVTIAPDPARQYYNFNSLMADPDGAVVGLRLATEQSAQTVSKLLQ